MACPRATRKRRRTVFGAGRFIRTPKSFGQPTESRFQLCRNATKRYSVEEPRLLHICHERPRNRTANERDELAAPHVWMAPAWQEIIWRAAQRSLAVMCPACWCSPGGLLALMGCANRVLIIQTGSMSR